MTGSFRRLATALWLLCALPSGAERLLVPMDLTQQMLEYSGKR